MTTCGLMPRARSDPSRLSSSKANVEVGAFPCPYQQAGYTIILWESLMKRCQSEEVVSARNRFIRRMRDLAAETLSFPAVGERGRDPRERDSEMRSRRKS